MTRGEELDAFCRDMREQSRKLAAANQQLAGQIHAMQRAVANTDARWPLLLAQAGRLGKLSAMPKTPVVVAPPRDPATTAGASEIPAAIWEKCWNNAKKYFDFSHDDWLKLPHAQQVAYAQAYQAWYAKNSGMPREKIVEIQGVQFAFCLIPPGQFWMGSPDNEAGRSGDETRHRVLISKPYYIGKTEVTQAQWLAVMGENPAYFKDNLQNPVEQVSWADCQEFCGKAGVKLPSEAQWEYACRAGSTGAYCFGDDESQLGDYAWYDKNSGSTTHPVGQKKPNAFGLCDMHGNVWEWCQDYYGDYAESAGNLSGVAENPAGAKTGSRRVIRGGSWLDCELGWLRSACRDRIDAGFRCYGLGARVVAEAK